MAVERDLVACFDIEKIFEHLAVAADMARQHDVSPLAGVGRPTMLPNRVFCDLPDRDLLIALLLDIPANLDHLRVHTNTRDGHARDSWGFGRLGAVGHRADHLAIGCDPSAGVEYRGSEWRRLLFGGRGYGCWRRQVGIAAC